MVRPRWLATDPLPPAGPAGGWVCDDCHWSGAEAGAVTHAERLLHRTRLPAPAGPVEAASGGRGGLLRRLRR